MSTTDSNLKHELPQSAEKIGEALWVEDFIEPAEVVFDPEPEGIAVPQFFSEIYPPFPNPFKHPLRAIAWVVRGAFGVVSLILLLAVVAAIPIVNFLALGYLLEAEGRVARSGKFRDAFPWLGLAPRFGSIALGVWLWILPLRLLSGYTADAVLIDPNSPLTGFLRFFTPFLAVVMTVYLCLALARGGKLWHFFWPFNVFWLIGRLRKGEYWETAERNVKGFLSELRLRHHFSLGVRGFLGAMAWLFIPTLLFASATTADGGPILLTVLGGFLLIFVFSWLPFLQARFAAENRLRAMFELRTVIDCFTRAPMAWFLAIAVTYVLALPLYLLKVRLPPQDAMWLATIVFIMSIYPARIITGLAYGRAARKQKRAWYDIGWLCRTLSIVLLFAYVFLFFFVRDIGEHGNRVLFEHHAFLLPWPM